MALSCPFCRNPLGLDLNFILKHPDSVCPGCGLILSFRMTDEMKKQTKDTLKKIEQIKKKYSNIAKFQ